MSRNKTALYGMRPLPIGRCMSFVGSSSMLRQYKQAATSLNQHEKATKLRYLEVEGSSGERILWVYKVHFYDKTPSVDLNRARVAGRIKEWKEFDND